MTDAGMWLAIGAIGVVGVGSVVLLYRAKPQVLAAQDRRLQDQLALSVANRPREVSLPLTRAQIEVAARTMQGYGYELERETALLGGVSVLQVTFRRIQG